MRIPGQRGAVTVSTTTVTTEQDAAPEQATGVTCYTDGGLSSDDEHCSIDPQLAEDLGITSDDLESIQIRVTRSTGEWAIFTVVALTQAAGDAYVGLNSGGFAKLDSVASSLSSCLVSTRVTFAGYTEAEADPDQGGDTEGLLREWSRDNGAATKALITAPHGGIIENYTDDQAVSCYEQLGEDTAALWCCAGFSKIYSTGGFGTKAASAYARFHITSTELDPRSFCYLGALERRGFTYVVSFHGISDATASTLGGGAADIIVGGNASQSLREAIATEIENITGFNTAAQGGQAGDGSFVARAAVTGDAPFSGTSSDNYVNELTGSVTDGVFTSSNAGIQIEQSSTVRAAFWQEIAQAVATVIAAQ